MIAHSLKGCLAAFSALLVLALGSPAMAELATPKGEVILTIDGAITQTNSPEGATFDLEMLRAMPASGFDTSSTWTEGTNRYDGVPLKALLDAVGATGGTITATALNNYSVQIPVDAIEDTVPIVAYHIDGETFSRRDKGPLWIVFPYDAGPAYQTELVYGWSIWQLAGLTISE
jgi:hypothetical protein